MTGFKSPPPFAKGKQTPPKPETKTETVNPQEISENPIEEGANMTEEVQAPPQKKEKQKRNSVLITRDHIKFVRQNVKTMGYNEMADKLGLTKNQINRILQFLKEGMRNKAVTEDSNAYGTKKNKKGEDVYDWTQPKSAYAKKAEAKIEAELSRPADTRPGGGAGGGQVQQALDSELDDLLAEL